MLVWQILTVQSVVIVTSVLILLSWLRAVHMVLTTYHFHLVLGWLNLWSLASWHTSRLAVVDIMCGLDLLFQMLRA